VNDSDPTDLSRLHDIVPAPPVPWWPPAPGWYVLAALIAVAVAALAWRWLVLRRRNAYRRRALALLEGLGTDAAAMPELAALVRRTALSAYPRAQVAPLAGEAWLAFLDRTGGRPAFTRGSGRHLVELAYGRGTLGPAEQRELLATARWWIRAHRVPAPAAGPPC
jgi:hypothetical protein